MKHIFTSWWPIKILILLLLIIAPSIQDWFFDETTTSCRIIADTLDQKQDSATLDKTVNQDKNTYFCKFFVGKVGYIAKISQYEHDQYAYLDNSGNEYINIHYYPKNIEHYRFGNAVNFSFGPFFMIAAVMLLKVLSFVLSPILSVWVRWMEEREQKSRDPYAPTGWVGHDGPKK